MADIKSQPPIATYNIDYTDLLRQRAILKLYGAKQASYYGGGGGTYFLSDEIIPTEYGTEFTEGLAGSGKAVDVDFDMEIAHAQVLEGTGICQINYILLGDTNVYFKIRIRKVSGGVESEVADVNTARTASQQRATLLIDIPKTKYKMGDTLRVTAEGWTTTSGVGAGAKFWHDPTGITDAGTPGDSEFIVWMPFKVVE